MNVNQKEKGGKVQMEMVRTCRESFMKTENKDMEQKANNREEWVSIIREIEPRGKEASTTT
jgi:phage replication-related protein YjqB (UPF0714/DUF867 family)